MASYDLGCLLRPLQERLLLPSGVPGQSSLRSGGGEPFPANLGLGPGPNTDLQASVLLTLQLVGWCVLHQQL